MRFSRVVPEQKRKFKNNYIQLVDKKNRSTERCCIYYYFCKLLNRLMSISSNFSSSKWCPFLLCYQWPLNISVECGEGWISFDNSCYKYESSQNMVVSPRDGNLFCSTTYPDSQLFVPNSRDESAFIGNYLTSLKVQVSLDEHRGFLRNFDLWNTKNTFGNFLENNLSANFVKVSRLGDGVRLA